eukprot:2246712-Rhodomonas_salina.2
MAYRSRRQTAPYAMSVPENDVTYRASPTKIRGGPGRGIRYVSTGHRRRKKATIRATWYSAWQDPSSDTVYDRAVAIGL